MTTEKKIPINWTSIRAKVATVKRLELYRSNTRESLDSIIRRALASHSKVERIRKKKAMEKSNG